MEKPRTIIKKYTIPILFNYQDSKLWIITGCGKVSKIAIPKNECYPDQKRCITISKGLLERLFSDGYSNTISSGISSSVRYS